jgi:hypothetical protein
MPRKALLAMLAPVLVLTGCGDDAVSGGDGLEDRLQQGSEGLCRVAVLVSEGRTREAGEAFEDRVHAMLHEVAAATEEVDRDAAAELLRAKQPVEDVLLSSRPVDPQTTGQRITQLQRALLEASRALGLGPPLCREGAA